MSRWCLKRVRGWCCNSKGDAHVVIKGDEEWMEAHLTMVNYVDIAAHILCTTVIAGIDNDGVSKMIVDVSYFSSLSKFPSLTM
ncbi:hypothetical protein RHSIM_Rhsim06G0121600 [Rhododendron simsii]|uniref:Uncharacterized protein n=1 Tax=Rhododendron simsii TaxID=118357 RepID=A0A834LN54_RHOSS|nr:hypothetical protein RHSIM_Rhsim06G0121600 [Rhododendron simsii]